MRNLRFMRSKALILCFLLSTPLLAGIRETEQQMQKITACIEEMNYQLNHHKVEIDLFHERIKGVEEGLSEGIQNLTKVQGKQFDSPRVKQLEEGQKALLADLKTLKGELLTCIAKQSELEKNLQSQMKEVQQNLQKALQILGGGKVEEQYTVKTGDSLGLIAQHHKTSVKALRDLNQLQGDQIYIGQKLKLPKS